MASVKRQDEAVLLLSSPPSERAAMDDLPSVGDFLLEDDDQEVFHPRNHGLGLGTSSKKAAERHIPSIDECIAVLMALFPHIDSEYIQELYITHSDRNPENFIEFLADRVLDTNGTYPKKYASREERSGKRKRARSLSLSDMTAEELGDEFGHNGRRAPSREYISITRKLLRNSFPHIPAAYIDSQLANSHNFLFPAYRELALQEENYHKVEKKPFRRLANPRKETCERDIMSQTNRPEEDDLSIIVGELASAKRVYGNITVRFQEEVSNSTRMDHDGLVDEEQFECGCCYSEVPFLKLTQCSDGHLFCLDCGRRNAETEIGQQKYKLLCLHSSGCRTPFPLTEIRRFCDEKMLEILAKLEQKDVLRQAEIEDLIDCPFCDFAAIGPPADEDREFRCENPSCMKISCRLCQKETHVPMTCEEKLKEGNSNLRRNVEEAMTEALLRKCGKCGLPYIKEAGCNKIVCSRCSAVNCYLCSKVIRNYQHFNDPARGGKTGNCALFDNTEERHQNEVRDAEKAAIAKIRQENPDITEEEMRIKLSQVVLDGERQKIRLGAQNLGNQNPHRGLGRVQVRGPPPIPFHQPQLPWNIFQIPPVPVYINQDPRFPPWLPPPYPLPPHLVPPLPVWGQPVNFVGGPPNPVLAIPPAPLMQPFNVFQRVANMLPNPRQIAPPNPNPMPQYPIGAGNMEGVDAAGGLIYNRYPRPLPPPHPPAPAVFPVKDNPGFLRRKFGDGRRLAQGHHARWGQQAAGAQVSGAPNRDANGAVNGQHEAEQNAVDRPPPRNGRPAKIIKRR